MHGGFQGGVCNACIPHLPLSSPPPLGVRLLQAFKAGERRLMEARVCQELGIDPDTFARLPRDLKVATWEGGAPGLLKAGFRPPKRVKAAAAAPAAGAADAGAAVADDDVQQGVEERRASHAAASSSNNSSSGSREGQQQYGPYRRRQWVFVAATMPSVTKGDIGTELQERFSSATWVQGDLLHQSKPKVGWVDVIEGLGGWMWAEGWGGWMLVSQEGLSGCKAGGRGMLALCSRVLVTSPCQGQPIHPCLKAIPSLMSSQFVTTR